MTVNEILINLILRRDIEINLLNSLLKLSHFSKTIALAIDKYNKQCKVFTYNYHISNSKPYFQKSH